MVNPDDVHLRLTCGVIPSVTFAWFGEVERGRVLPEHAHQSYFIDYISRGAVRWFRNGAPTRLEPGWAYLYRGEEVLSGVVDGREPVVVRGVGFHWPVPAAKRGRAGEFALPKAIKLSSAGRADFEQTFDGMLRVYTRGGKLWREAVGGYIVALLGLLSAECDATTTNPVDPRLNLALQFMQTHFRRALKMNEVAGAAQLSETYFRRRFTEWQNKSPLQYLIDLRLQEARRLLVTEYDRPVRLIARAAGFGDEKHFTRLFQARYGSPPGAFRRAGWVERAKR